MSDSERLSIAIQKSGRLNEDSIQLLKDCGLRFNKADNKLKTEADNFPLTIYFLRDDDIPGYVADGVADLGIVGQNVLVESQSNCAVLSELGFGKCRLSLAVPKASGLRTLTDLNGRRIATSYPYLLGQFLKEQLIEAEIHEISGSVEIAPSIGLAHAICDLVSSGSTLISNGSEELLPIYYSQAVLIGRGTSMPTVASLTEELLFRIASVQKARSYKYILLNCPREAVETICSLLPGVKSPTIMPLADPAWCSLHSVVRESDFWTIVGRLRAAGAEGILVLPIEKMIG
jgi:ATP phosphoribosyltransferase